MTKALDAKHVKMGLELVTLESMRISFLGSLNLALTTMLTHSFGFLRNVFLV